MQDALWDAEAHLGSGLAAMKEEHPELLESEALAEGRLVEALLDVRMPRRPSLLPEGKGWMERRKNLLTDGHTWTNLLYLVLHLLVQK